jgi:tetratricopeptide (TPR) repeat protein
MAAAAGDEAMAYLGAADRLYSEEQYREAVDQYEAALRADPTLEAARRQLAICLFQIKDYDRARPLFAQLLSQRKTLRLAHYYLGRMELLHGAPTAALVHLQKVVGAQPFQDEYYFLASANFKLDRYSVCSGFLRKQIALNPRDSRAHLLLARVHRKRGEDEAAEREFAETRRLSEYYLEGSTALKRCRLALSSDSSQILEECHSLLETDDVDKLSAAGVIFGQAQHYAEARESLARAAILDPDSPEVRYNLALSCFHLREFEEAKTNVAAALQARPEFPEANVLYGTLLYMAGLDREAIPVLRRAHRLSPQDQSVRRLLAKELLNEADHAVTEGRMTDARGQLEEAGPLAPGSDEISRLIAEVRSRLNSRSSTSTP